MKKRLFFTIVIARSVSDEATQVWYKSLFEKNLYQAYATLFSWIASSSTIPRNDDAGIVDIEYSRLIWIVRVVTKALTYV